MPLVERLESADAVRVVWHIDADADAVWEYLTEPARLPTWLGRPELVDLRPGGRIRVDHGDGYSCDCRVIVVEPAVHLDMTWKFPDEPESAVTFGLSAADAGCALRLLHSGLDGLASSYADGWPVHLTYLEAAVLGDPLPASQFWNLHATMSRLSASPGRSG